MNRSKLYLEHANLTVTNIDEATQFFKTAFPHFVVRGGGDRNAGERWQHVGDDVTYIALTERKNAKPMPKNYDLNGFNHIGFVVDNVNEIAQRLAQAGYARSYPKQVQPTRIRDYFVDGDGNEYEFVQYLSDKTSERNTYDD